ncbi:hypothetical protein EBQ34_10735 [Vandammella animalimorsus]|uniref:Uncharacterized protein n=2 Tax=Vandammella animalimorsus TaxID=2029117 RepID=A0A3M6R7J0_9BURK|nr:hypothetical protein EBQ34_10735 [Vandammella animalimorsus]
MVFASQECVQEVRVNDNSLILNKTTRAEVEKIFGAAQELRGMYEVPYYDLCYKMSGGDASLMFGFQSGSDLLRSVQMGVWNSALDERIRCAEFPLNKVSLNSKVLGQGEKKSTDSTQVLMKHCTIRKIDRAFSGILVDSGVYLIDLE